MVTIAEGERLTVPRDISARGLGSRHVRQELAGPLIGRISQGVCEVVSSGFLAILVVARGLRMSPVLAPDTNGLTLLDQLSERFALYGF